MGRTRVCGKARETEEESVIAKYEPPPRTTDEIVARVADGIALGGDYNSVFDRYVEAHNDRKYLLEVLLKILVETKDIRDKT
jgi:hypothetical protein